MSDYLALSIKVISVEMGSLERDYFCIEDTSHFEEPCIEVIGNIHTTPELLEES